MAFFAFPFIDTISSISRRLLHGYGPFTANKSHLHHQPLDTGLSQRQVALVFYGIASIVSTVGVLCFRWQEPYATVVLASLACLLLALMYFLPRIRVRLVGKKPVVRLSQPGAFSEKTKS